VGFEILRIYMIWYMYMGVESGVREMERESGEISKMTALTPIKHE